MTLEDRIQASEDRIMALLNRRFNRLEAKLDQMIETKEWFSINDAAEQLNVSPKTVTRHINLNKLEWKWNESQTRKLVRIPKDKRGVALSLAV